MLPTTAHLKREAGATTSMISFEFSLEILGAACPSELPLYSFAIAQIALKTGQARLVPPTIRPDVSPSSVSTTGNPVAGSATAATSGTCRHEPGSVLCHVGFV